ncbi:MAG TPA: hypothetical protein VL128_12210 [Candidatus Eisenbacteria bacterium]|nr:hypothetical protein [Candidatus Eisenbacteria bacterium]
MTFSLKDKGIFQNGESQPLLRDQQASDEVLRYVVDALNEKWQRSPQQLATHPAPTGHGKPLGRG